MERMRVSCRRGLAAGLTMALVLAAAGSGIARGQEAPPRPGSLARYVPRQDDLFFFLEFDGLDAHQAAWKESAAHKLLDETKLGALIESLITQSIEAVQQDQPPEKRVKPAELIGLIKLGARRGFAVGAWGQGPQESMVFVLRGGGRPEVVRLLETSAAGPPALAPKSIAGRTLRRSGAQTWWWVEKGDLVFSSRPELVLSAIDGQASNMADHPVPTALRRKSDGFEPVAVGFFDLAAMPPMPPRAVQLGFDGLKRVDFRWGIQDDALLAVVDLVAPQPRRGVMAMLDQPTFAVDSLPPLPAGLTGFAVLSLDPDRLYGQIAEVARQANPGGGEGFAQLEQAIRQRFDFDLRKDVLRQLGPRFAVYTPAPPPGGAALATALIGQFAGLTIAAEARDQALAPNLDKLVEAINLVIRSRQASARPGQPVPDAAAIGFLKQEAKQPTYMLNFPTGSVPPALKMMMRPTLKLGKDRLVLGATPAAANRSFNLATMPADQLWKPTEKFVPMAGRLPRDMVLLVVTDPRDTLPALVESLPAMLPQINMLFPALGAAREAARRAECVNNLKQISLAVHSYLGAHGAFPAPSLKGKDGKPTLSWRVAILPYLEQQTLYEKFHLDEPWDSPHNKELIKEMPRAFGCPDLAVAVPGTTNYRLFVGPKALFQAGQEKRLQGKNDGLGNTILAVEAKDAVPWTKPDAELPFDPDAAPSLYGAGSPHPGGFQAVFADGSVRMLSDRLAPSTFRSMITWDAGDAVEWGKVPPPNASRPPRPDGPLRVDRAMIPRADELRPLLFPASLAISTDREGIRIVSREPITSLSSPSVSGVVVALLLPAVQAAREAARRAQCVNNLKQMALAMHNYHDTHGHFPGAIAGKDGKRLLSWRVALLPYLEQKALYDRFKLDEPWDSPHNKPLIDEMPTTFACPSRPLRSGRTPYRGFVGQGAFFEKGQEVSVANILDGTSNTIMIVEAGEDVPWTSPDSDLPFDPQARPSLYGAGSTHPGGFNAAMADGSVRFLKNGISPIVLRALITRAGGEVIQGGAF